MEVSRAGWARGSRPYWGPFRPGRRLVAIDGAHGMRGPPIQIPGLSYYHETFGIRDRIESQRFLRTLRRTRVFANVSARMLHARSEHNTIYRYSSSVRYNWLRYRKEIGGVPTPSAGVVLFDQYP